MTIFAHIVIDDAMPGINAKVREIRTSQARQEAKEILNWLAKKGYGSVHSSAFKSWQPGTAQWFLESAEYQNWLTGAKGRLLCHGMQGAGKTVIAAIAINHSRTMADEDESLGVAFIYFNINERDEQSPENLLASLVKHLGNGKGPSLSPLIAQLFERHQRHQTRPSLNELSTLFRHISTTYSDIHIIIDALDECNSRSRRTLLREIFSAQELPGVNIRVLVTSRPNGDIQQLFNGFPSLEIYARDDDVRIYVGERISELNSVIVNDDIRDNIMETVVSEARGM